MNWKEFDYIWDERGEKAAVLALPFEPDAEILSIEPFPERERCIHCGDLPQMVEAGPYRVKRSFARWVTGQIPFWVDGSTEGMFCDCWEPQGGFNSSLEFR